LPNYAVRCIVFYRLIHSFLAFDQTEIIKLLILLKNNLYFVFEERKFVSYKFIYGGYN